MYTLQVRNIQTGWTWANGERSGSMRDLRAKADLQNTDYRIIDERGKEVWSFDHKVR